MVFYRHCFEYEYHQYIAITCKIKHPTVTQQPRPCTRKSSCVFIKTIRGSNPSRNKNNNKIRKFKKSTAISNTAKKLYLRPYSEKKSFLTKFGM